MEQRKHYEGRPKQHMAYGEYYTDGSAARKVVPMQPERTRHRSADRQSAAVKNSAVPKKPMHRPSQPKMDPKKTHLEQQKQMQVEKRKQVNQKVAMRNREKALKIDWKYTIFLCGAVLAVLLSCVLYLSVQTELTQKSSVIPLAGSCIYTKIPGADMLLEEMVTKFSNLVILQRGTFFQNLVYVIIRTQIYVTIRLNYVNFRHLLRRL